MPRKEIPTNPPACGSVQIGAELFHWKLEVINAAPPVDSGRVEQLRILSLTPFGTEAKPNDSGDPGAGAPRIGNRRPGARITSGG